MLAQDLIAHLVKNSRTVHPATDANRFPTMPDLTSPTLAESHMSRHFPDLLDPRSTTRQMSIQHAGRTSKLPCHLGRRHMAGRQHGAGSPYLGGIQRLRATTTPSTSSGSNHAPSVKAQPSSKNNSAMNSPSIGQCLLVVPRRVLSILQCTCASPSCCQ
jgi:hypothetical protein